MVSLSRTFQKQFEGNFSVLGFNRYKNYFYRIINDVVQIIALKKHAYECTLEFAIDPLCFWSNTSFSSFGGYNISMRRKGYLKGWDWRLRKSDIVDQINGQPRVIAFDNTSADWVVRDMLNIVSEEIIPILAKALSCETALSELERYEQRTYGKLLFLPISRSTYYLYLKTGHIDRAKEYLQKLLVEESDRMHNGKIIAAAHQLKILEANDFNLLNHMIAEKEEAAKNYFSSLR